MNTLTDELKEKAKKLNKTIILPETEDERVLRATEKIINEGIAKIALVGNEKEIKERADKIGVSLEGAIFYNPDSCATIDAMSELLKKRREKKGMTFETAKAILCQIQDILRQCLYIKAELMEWWQVHLLQQHTF